MYDFLDFAINPGWISVTTNKSFLGIKLRIIFKMVFLKIETCIFGPTLSNALFQSKSTACRMSSILACL